MKTHTIDVSLTDMLTVAFDTLCEANEYVNGWLDSCGAGVVRTAATGSATTTKNKRHNADVDLNSESQMRTPTCIKNLIGNIGEAQTPATLGKR
jgi:hypothetical protein